MLLTLKSRVVRGGVAVTMLLFAVSIAIMSVTAGKVRAQGITFNSTRNCDNNAVIFCGAMSPDELLQKFNANSSVDAIYMAFNITPQNVADMNTTAVAGQVASSGDVFVNGTKVAASAVTAGRLDIPGSTKVVNNGVTFFERPPRVSFVSSPLDAFVVMQNGRFAFAILASCGNPVNAMPVVTPAAAPVATPAPMPTPTPTPTPPAPVMQSQAQSQVQTTTVNVTPAAVPQSTTPTPAVQAAQTQAAPQALPKTGPGTGIAAIFGATTLLGTAARYLMLRRRLSFGG